MVLGLMGERPAAGGGDPPRVVVVDDHDLVRQGLLRAFEGAPDRGVVVGEAATAADARTVVERTAPDVVVLDVVLPDGDGIQLCREIRSRDPGTACVLLTSFPEPRAMLAAALAGAAAFVAKHHSTPDLLRAVAAAAAGERLLDRAEVARILDRLADPPADGGGPARLTDRERQVFELMGQGLSNRQIAERLHLAEQTVKNYSSRILAKLDMDGRAEVAALSARLAERRAQQRARGLDGR